MLNLNKNNILISVPSFMLAVVLPLFISFLKEVPNVLYIPLAFTAFAVLISKTANIPISKRADVNTIAVLVFVMSALVFLLSAILGNNPLSIYSLLMVLLYTIIPHMLLSVIFQLNRKEG